MAIEFLDSLGLTKLINNCKNTFAPIIHIHTINDVADLVIDSSLSSVSTNPIQNKEVAIALSTIQENIDSVNDAINQKDLIIANLQSFDADLQSQINALINEDVDKSIRTIANEELTKQLVPQTAQESLDTLEEISIWIQEHPEHAASMNASIVELQNLIGEGFEEITNAQIDEIFEG